MPFGANVGLLVLALVLEAAIGYPEPLFRLIGHPVSWIGRLVGFLDRALNRTALSPRQGQLCGVATLAIVAFVAAAVAYALQRGLLALTGGWIVIVVVAASLIAQRSLYRHVADVADAIERNGLAAGRAAIAKVVGRNPATLDESGICRAAIETLAENFSDGVVAPAFWFVVAGLPGMAVYKAINTADSMVGHRTPRHEFFGWAAARCDDLMNLPASRLTASFLVLAALFRFRSRAGAAIRAVQRDARHHRSPNAGWCEAAMAGALDLKLAGPRVYGDVAVDDAWMGDGRTAATVADVRAALSLYRIACGILWGVAAVAALALAR